MVHPVTPVAAAAFAALRAIRSGVPEAVVRPRLEQELVALELLKKHHGTWPTVAAPRFDVDEDCGPSEGRAGYDRHRKLAEAPCRSCLAAARAEWRRNERIKKGRVA